MCKGIGKKEIIFVPIFILCFFISIIGAVYMILVLFFDELLYTGLTRSKRDLVVINFGNAEYDKKIRPLIEKLKYFFLRT